MQTAQYRGGIAPDLLPSFNPMPWRPFTSISSGPAAEVIYLVENDPRIRTELTAILEARELGAICFPSAAAYLAFDRNDRSACLVVDMHLPDVGGLELQRRLAEQDHPPVIFISGACDIPSTVQAMKAGAIEFLTKPVDPMALLSAVRAALAQDKKQRQRKAELGKLQRRFRLLTPREREVLPLIVGGLLNKQAASVLGISEVTLQIHRGQVMRKMEAASFADLVRMAMRLRISHFRESPSGHSTGRSLAQPAATFHSVA